MKRYSYTNRIKILVLSSLLLLTFSFCSSGGDDISTPFPEPKPDYQIASVEKRTDMRIFVHYMPWFQTKNYSGTWGMHWTMAKCNPDKILSNGQREIASHFYPLIGPYDSNDDKVLDYHALLMKYSGIEGVLVDWYGSRNGAESTEKLFKAMQKAGLQLAIVYEDRNNLDGATSLDQMIQWGTADMHYLEKNFFNSSSYIKVNGKPLLMCFGPIALSKDIYAHSPANWSEIFAALATKPCFMSLYGHADNASDKNNGNVSGEFTWVDKNNQSFYDELRDKYGSTFMASAYPGFKDYYAQGGWGNSIGNVDYRNGQEFQDQLNVVDSKKCPMIQLVTWNDFGEGTQIEPTIEDQYKYLEKIQTFAKVKYGKPVLESIFKYYTLTVKYSNNKQAMTILNEAYQAFVSLLPDRAEILMNQLQ